MGCTVKRRQRQEEPQVGSEPLATDPKGSEKAQKLASEGVISGTKSENKGCQSSRNPTISISTAYLAF